MKSLLTNVSALIDLDPTQRISIKRGVKQGCPLSPILFILAYDPLLKALEHSNLGFDICAAADDLALGGVDFDNIVQAFSLVQAFRVSGLGINTDKTVIISTLNFKERHKASIKNSIWPDILLQH